MVVGKECVHLDDRDKSYPKSKGGMLDEYNKLIDSLQFTQTDYTLAEKHIEDLSRFAIRTNSAITLYNSVIGETIYRSDNYCSLFGTDEEIIHPDDLEAVLRSAIIALRYFFIGNKNVTNHRLIRRYRARVKGEYRVVIERVQPLEVDGNGNVWLSFDIIDIAPNQSLPYVVESKIINHRTGDIITPVDSYFDGKPILSTRETEILRLIDKGFLSKEISAKLCISVHTVNTHRQRILEKLKVGTSLEAIKYASALGVL